MKKERTTIFLQDKEGNRQLPLMAEGYKWKWHEFEFLVHRPISVAVDADPLDPFLNEGWVVTETATGKRVSSEIHQTRTKAVAEMAAKLPSLGREKFRRLVAANLT